MSDTPLLPHPVAALALLSELEAEEARLFARKARALVDYREQCRALAPEGEGAAFVALDLAVACGIAQVTATSRLAQAEQLVGLLPGTLALLGEGRLRVGQALVLLEETKGLDEVLTRRLETVVLPLVEGMTAGETRRLVKQTLVRLDADASEVRRREQHRARRVFVSSKPDGRAFVGVHGSAEAALGFWEDLTLLAKLTFGADDPRTLDQQRADLALGLSGFALSSRRGHGPSLRSWLGLPDETDAGACTLAGRNALSAGQQRRVQAVVLVPVQTGLGLSEDPGELLGYGSVSGQHARDLLAAAELRKACVDVTSGRLIAPSDERLRPPGWSGRFWASAHPASEAVELHGYRHAPPPDSAPSPSVARPLAAAMSGSGSVLEQSCAALPTKPPPPSPAPDPVPPGRPITLFDALLQLVHTPLPAESRVEPRHDPSPGLADLVRFRDPRCIGPGCSQPSRACDLEHWTPYPEGTTSADNLGPASRRCHNAKTYGGWSYTPHPDGSTTWTTPWGQTYRKASRTQHVDLHDLTPRQVGPPPHQRPLPD